MFASLHGDAFPFVVNALAFPLLFDALALGEPLRVPAQGLGFRV
jgi:hypothetical protein